MNGFILTEEEELQLRIAHQTIRDKRYAYRINAIILLSHGWSYEEIANALLLDEETIRNYVKRYREGGTDALITDNDKGSAAKLTAEQLTELDKHLQKNTYLMVEAIIAY